MRIDSVISSTHYGFFGGKALKQGNHVSNKPAPVCVPVFECEKDPDQEHLYIFLCIHACFCFSCLT